MAMTDAKRILAGTSKSSSNIKLHLQSKSQVMKKAYQQLMDQITVQMWGKGQFDGTYNNQIIVREFLASCPFQT